MEHISRVDARMAGGAVRIEIMGRGSGRPGIHFLHFPKSSELPDRPKQYGGEQRGRQAIEAIATEVHHVAEAENICRSRCHCESEQRYPNPTGGRRDQQSEDHDVKDDANITVRNPEWSRERGVGHPFTLMTEEGTDQATHEAALI